MSTEPLRFYCAECHRLAGTVELLPPTAQPSSPDDVGYDRWELKVDGPVQVTHWILRGLDELKAALHDGSVEALLAINPEYVHFWCPKCAATYCREHWYPIDPTMDEGFYDATYGTCPKGHKVMLDD